MGEQPRTTDIIVVIVDNREVENFAFTLKPDVKNLRPFARNQTDFIADFEVADFFPFAFVIG